MTFCPSCSMPEEVTDSIVFASTDGPVEMLRLRCLGGHWRDTYGAAQAVD